MRAALEEGRRHEIDGGVLKVAKSSLMSSVANGGMRVGGGGAGAAGRGHGRDRDKEQPTVQRLENIIKCINCSR